MYICAYTCISIDARLLAVCVIFAVATFVLIRVSCSCRAPAALLPHVITISISCSVRGLDLVAGLPRHRRQRDPLRSIRYEPCHRKALTDLGTPDCRDVFTQWRGLLV